jgi:putative (di)nucleoside polyphosphate hydrolase
LIDEQGYRKNIGIIIINQTQHVFWARRAGQDAWQFPQGGMQLGESFEQALYRELHEEVGLGQQDVEIIASTQDWLRYQIPEQFIRRDQRPLCIGQKQKWFLLRLLTNEQKLRMDLSDTPEFDSWRWVDYWYPLRHVVEFKRQVYQEALQEFANVLSITTPKEMSPCL